MADKKIKSIVLDGEQYDLQGESNAGFKNVSDLGYQNGLLTSFNGDDVNYELKYTLGRLTGIKTDDKEYNIKYTNGRLVSISEI